MTLTEFSLKKPTIIIAFYVTVVIAGIYSYTKLSYELMPDFSQPTLEIKTGYPGASPQDVEDDISKRIENLLAGIDDIRHIHTQSYEGISVVKAEFFPRADMDDAEGEVQQLIDKNETSFPEASDKPVVEQVTPNDLPIIRITATSSLNESDMFDLIDDDIVPELQRINGVGEVTMTGGRKREIHVNVNRDKLLSHRLSLTDINRALSTSNFDFPMGKVKTMKSQSSIRLSGRYHSLEQIRSQVVAVKAGGEMIRLTDVSDVADIVQDANSISRLNGKNGIGLTIKKQNDANAVDISRAVRQKIEDLQLRHQNTNLKLVVASDSSDFTLLASRAVTFDLALAVILVALVMLVFLHSLRDSLIVLVSIPVSLIFSFIIMLALNFTLNLMTLLAMSLVIGILVDDSIVVLENINRHLRLGKNQVAAAIDGRNEIGFAAISITIVDVVVFTPIAFIDTTVGDILRQFSVTIVVSTLMSLLVCFTLTPWLASRYSKAFSLNPSFILHRPLIWVEQQLFTLTDYYAKLLRWVLRHKLITSGVILLLFVITILIARLELLGHELVASGDQGQISIKIEFDRSITIEENNIRTLEIEQFILTQPEVRDIFSNIGGASAAGFHGSNGVASENRSEITVMLQEGSKRGVSTEAFMLRIRHMLTSRFSDVKFATNVVGIAGSEKPIHITLQGSDRALLMSEAHRIKLLLQSEPGASDITLSAEESSADLEVIPDRERMARLGLNLYEVGTEMMFAFTGRSDSKFRDEGRDYDIFIRFDNLDRNTQRDIESVAFKNYRGESIPLLQFAQISTAKNAAVLEREDRINAISIKCNLLGTTSGTFARRIDEALKKQPLPPTVLFSWSGDVTHMHDSFSALGLAIGAAVLLVYLVMVILFENFTHPFVVLFSLPVAFIGAIIALNVGMGSISVFTMLGIIMLLGLVAKNGILLVDFTNEKLRHGVPLEQSLVEAGKVRLKPILMTTVSMIIGMVPIALASGAGSEWKNSMAFVLIGGLTSSMLLTVFVVPMVYMVLESIKRKLSGDRKIRATKTVFKEDSVTVNF